MEDIGGGRTGNIRMEVVENFTANINEVGIDNMLADSAAIQTDGHKSLCKIEEGWPGF